MLDIEIHEATCEGSLLLKSKKHRLVLSCEEPVKALGLERTESRYIDALGGITQWTTPFGSKFTLATDSDSSPEEVVFSLRRSRRFRDDEVLAKCTLDCTSAASGETKSITLDMVSNGVLAGTTLTLKLTITLRKNAQVISNIMTPPVIRSDSTANKVVADDSTVKAIAISEVTDSSIVRSDSMAKEEAIDHSNVEADTKSQDADSPSMSDSLINHAAIEAIAKHGATWDTLLARLEIVVKLGDQLAELHPMAKLAWGVVKLGYDAISSQIGRDAKLKDLVEAMVNACSFAEQAEPLTALSKHQRTMVNRILQQVIQCTYFIKAYCKDSFGLRLFKNTSSDAGKQVDKYMSNLKALQSALGTVSAIEGTVIVYQVLDDVLAQGKILQEHDMRAILDDLFYAKEARQDIKQGCLPGTREEVLDAILCWAAQAAPQSVLGNSVGNDITYTFDSHVLWICGLSGSGKSTIARSVAARLKDIGRLGSFYAFDNARQATLNPSTLFSTIARDLADCDPSRKKQLVESIRNDTALRKSPNVSEQFDEFIVAPSSKLTGIGDTIIIIDAFDESASISVREELLSILTSRAAEIPDGLKFIVTSRYESDVQEALEKDARPSGVDVFLLDDVPEDSTSRDIATFVNFTLGSVKQLKRHVSDLERLAVMAENSFQWASTACRFIRASDDGEGGSPKDRLKKVLDGERGLDNLYKLILDRNFRAAPSEILSRLHAITGLMICAMEPLPLGALITFSLNYNEPTEDDIDDYQQMARCLGSLISGTHDLSTSVKPLHTSFTDFLRDTNRSGRYSIDMTQIKDRLPRRCLEIMVQDGLRFNICEFPTSLQRNRDVKSLDEVIRLRISALLSYSSRHWSQHLVNLSDSNKESIEIEIEPLLLSLLQTHFLHWLEVMSVLGSNPYAALMTISNQVSLSTMSTELKILVSEATRFTSTFLVPIMESMPHIYLSCLSFVPTISRIPNNQSDYSSLVNVKTGREEAWKSHVTVLEGHLGRVNCVAFAPIGLLIASGSDDNTIRLWNRNTSDSIIMKKHTKAVNCLAFSPDGARLISGSSDNSIVVWDVNTALPVLDPLLVHENDVISIAYSPLSNLFASGGRDQIVCMWDASSGKPSGSPLEGLTGPVESISFSSNGAQLVAGGRFNTLVRVWDVNTRSLLSSIGTGSFWTLNLFTPESSHIIVTNIDREILSVNHITGDMIGQPFGKHDSDIKSISISACDSAGYFEVVTGSEDSSIRFWDPNKGVEIGPRLYGHAAGVNAVAYSPDGTLVVSGSDDRTVRVWSRQDAEEGAQPLEQHRGCISAVTYSPDGLHIATASNDRTVRIWKIDDGKLVGKLEGVHQNWIRSLDYSPDGTRIITCSDDRSIQLWDTKMLKPVGEPWLGHKNWVLSIAFSPTGNIFVSGSKDNTVGIWDMSTSPPSSRFLAGHEWCVTSVAFSPEGTTFASASYDETIIIWDVKAAAPVGNPIRGNDGFFWCVAYSPDGTKLAAGSDHQATVWDVGNRRILHQLFVGSLIQSVAFSPCGEYLATASADHAIYLWELKRNSVLGTPLCGHDSAVTGVAFSPNGLQVASVSEDNTVRVWDVCIMPDPTYLPEDFVLYDRRQYPLSLFPGHSFDMRGDGWIMNPDGGLILWVPPAYRPGLRGPGVRVLNNVPITELDFEHFKCGTEWTKCYQSS